MPKFGLGIVACLVATMFITGGMIAADSSTAIACKDIGKVRLNGEIYECRKVPK